MKRGGSGGPTAWIDPSGRRGSPDRGPPDGRLCRKGIRGSGLPFLRFVRKRLSSGPPPPPGAEMIRHPLTTALLLAMAASAAHAQSPGAPADAARTLDTVIVTGTRVANRTVAESQSP